MLQPHEIKEEPIDTPNSKCETNKGNSSTPPPTLKCTCKKKRLSEPAALSKTTDSKKARQVLVNFGLSRRKVFTLNKEKDRLHDLFTSYVLSEPAFSKLLKDSYVVFQEFSHKFGTWVDIDKDCLIEDGTVLKAVFFPSMIERDDSNPGSIKRKIDDSISLNVPKHARFDGTVVDIESSGDEGQNASLTKHKSLNDDAELSKYQKHKNNKKKVQEKQKKQTSKRMEEDEDSGSSDESIKKEPESVPTAGNLTTEHENKFVKHSEMLSKSQEATLDEKPDEAPYQDQRPFIPQNPYKYSSHNKYQTERNYNSVYHQNTRGISDIR